MYINTTFMSNYHDTNLKTLSESLLDMTFESLGQVQVRVDQVVSRSGQILTGIG